MRTLESRLLFLFVVVWAAPAWTQDPARTKKSADDEKMRRYEEALDQLATADDVRAMKRYLKILSDGFPASRPVLVEAARRSSSPRLRALALKLLGDHGEAKTDLEVVAEGLRDRVSSVRMAAVMALRRLGEPAFQVTLRHLPREVEPNIRKMIVRNLKILGNPAAILPLARSLRNEKHRGVRKYTVRALRSLSGETFGDDADTWVSFAEDYVDRKNAERILEYTRSLQKQPNKRESRK